MKPKWADTAAADAREKSTDDVQSASKTTTRRAWKVIDAYRAADAKIATIRHK